MSKDRIGEALLAAEEAFEKLTHSQIAAREAIEALGQAIETQSDTSIAHQARRELLEGREESIPDDVAKALMDGQNALRVYRKYRGMTQTQLAGATGVDQATISDLENGNIANPGIRTLKALADGLGVTVDDLVD